MKHTPGVWIINMTPEPRFRADGELEDAEGFIGVYSEGTNARCVPICQIFSEVGSVNGDVEDPDTWYCISKREARANAALIAAAPDMLEALKQAHVIVFMSQGAESELYKRISAIINKAEAKNV